MNRLLEQLQSFDTTREDACIAGSDVPQFVGEFWTSRQRQASSLHEISYRACFKAQLPRFFIERFAKPGDVVYDPFSGRGTTALEAALLGRSIVANDINPLSEMLTRPRLAPPSLTRLYERLESIPFDPNAHAEIDLSMFYHRDTESEIVSLRKYLEVKRQTGNEDDLDRWIRMTATNRLTGHSKGFFSVYTLPPNQAVTADRQILINNKLEQKPEYRNVRSIILKKSKSLLRGITAPVRAALAESRSSARFLTGDARRTEAIEPESVRLTVTSPPFLDIVQYSADNWLRCWFNGIDANEVAGHITMARTVKQWSEVMQEVFHELHRITTPGGWVAFEVGEVRNKKVKLEEHVVPLGVASGFESVAILINQQLFTKTANIWGVKNNDKGTNSNRIVLFRKP